MSQRIWKTSDETPRDLAFASGTPAQPRPRPITEAQKHRWRKLARGWTFDDLDAVMDVEYLNTVIELFDYLGLAQETIVELVSPHWYNRLVEQNQRLAHMYSDNQSIRMDKVEED